MVPIEGRRILLHGGAGFIGHNLALHLQMLGAEVTIIDSLQVNNLLTFNSAENNIVGREFYLKILNQRLDFLRKADVSMYVQDLREYHALSKLIKGINPQVIIHLAAVSNASKSNKDPYSTFDHSLRTLENALDCARSMRIEHFIYFSSSMIYGNFPSGYVDEATPCNPVGIYGALKFSGEKMVIAYNQTFGLSYTIVRPSALYGERCVSRRVGQIFIENALQGMEITIRGNGSDCLDFTYIEDLIQGIVKVIQNEEARNQIFNLTYGASRTLSDMAAIIEQHFHNVNIQYVPKDKLTPDRGTLSVDKAKEMIGYEPVWHLEKGLVKYINWYEDMVKECHSIGEIGFILG